MLLLALALAAPTNTLVKVEGRTYRVEVKGDTVKVANKAVFTRRSLEGRARMRAAAKLVTGCRMVDDYWQEAILEGLLNCSPTGSR